MLVGHLLCGLVLGILVAATSLVAGYPLWAVLGFYVISVNLGLFGSLLLRSAGERRRLGHNAGASEHYPTPSA